MKRQKSIFQSKTVRTALINHGLAIMLAIQQANEQGFNQNTFVEILTFTVLGLATIYYRYTAKGELYTPNGLPGRDYVSPQSREYQTEEDFL